MGSDWCGRTILPPTSRLRPAFHLHPFDPELALGYSEAAGCLQLALQITWLSKVMAPEDSPTLEPPKGPSEDPGAHDLSSDSDDHFSDAQSGLSSAEHSPNVIGNSTVLVVNTQNETAGRLGSEDYSATPGGLPVPKTVVEKVDPENPSHGEVPGTLAHEKRLADAIPDEIVTDEHPSSADASESQPNPTDLPIPTTIVEKVTADPSHGEVPGTDSFEKRKGDAEPDLVKVKNRGKSL